MPKKMLDWAVQNVLYYNTKNIQNFTRNIQDPKNKHHGKVFSGERKLFYEWLETHMREGKEGKYIE